MKMMKLIKALSVFLICLTFTSCVGCSPISFVYEYEELSDNVAVVELIYYDNLRTRPVRDYNNHPNFDFDKMEYIATIQGEMREEFLKTISNTLILNHVSHQNSPNGICVKIIYEDGYFDIVSSGYIGRFDSDGEFIEYMGTFNAGLRPFYLFIINFLKEEQP